MIYLALKHLHVACVLASGAGFFLRGLFMLAERPPGNRWVHILPHLIDTVLLGSAIALAVIRTRAWRAAFFVAALLVYAYIVSVALTRNPLGVLALIASA